MFKPKRLVFKKSSAENIVSRSAEQLESSKDMIKQQIEDISVEEAMQSFYDDSMSLFNSASEKISKLDIDEEEKRKQVERLDNIYKDAESEVEASKEIYNQLSNFYVNRAATKALFENDIFKNSTGSLEDVAGAKEVLDEIRDRMTSLRESPLPSEKNEERDAIVAELSNGEERITGWISDVTGKAEGMLDAHTERMAAVQAALDKGETPSLAAMDALTSTGQMDLLDRISEVDAGESEVVKGLKDTAAKQAEETRILSEKGNAKIDEELAKRDEKYTENLDYVKKLEAQAERMKTWWNKVETGEAEVPTIDAKRAAQEAAEKAEKAYLVNKERFERWRHLLEEAGEEEAVPDFEPEEMPIAEAEIEKASKKKEG